MPEVRIDRIDVETGWAIFKAGDPPPPDDSLPFYLHDALQQWLTRNTHLSVRATLPIVQGGNTVAIHVWFD